MTGYGKAELNLPDKKITVEIKSLNSKNIDTNVKIPAFYREKEMQIRKMIQEELKRGKVDFTIFYELNEGVTVSSINEGVVKAYFKQLTTLKKELGLDSSDLLSAILRLPDSIKTDRLEADENEWKEIEKTISKAISELKKFRIQEGESMKMDLAERSTNILKYLKTIDPLENDRIQKLREKILRSLDELNLSETADSNRFEQEMIYYMEKLDISEEKTRLENHCKYFMETLNDGDDTGKKLSFISQEMGREINTLGSKASDTSIQHIVVKMKDELEKIKEQVLNIL
jgi:uncharacterized protein (TIGR00255 family)